MQMEASTLVMIKKSLRTSIRSVKEKSILLWSNFRRRLRNLRVRQKKAKRRSKESRI